MNQKSFNRAQQLYDIIRITQGDIKGIKNYEQRYYNKGVPLVLKVPWAIGVCNVDHDITITDREHIREILNYIKIQCVKTIQDAEKELETL